MRATWISSIIVNETELSVYQHENGGIIAIDSSYLDQVATEHETEDCYVIPDPLSNIDELSLLFLYDE